MPRNKTRQKQKNKKKEERIDSLIKNVNTDQLVAINNILEEDYPIFCFKYLSDVSFKDCQNHQFFIKFLTRLRELSKQGWGEIRKSQRHVYGLESIPIDNIKPQKPACITPEIKKLHVFRADNENLPFVGLQVGRVFRVLFIETKFGDVYDH